MIRLGPLVVATGREFDDMMFTATALASSMLRARVFELTVECARLRVELRRLGETAGRVLADEVEQALRDGNC